MDGSKQSTFLFLLVSLEASKEYKIIRPDKVIIFTWCSVFFGRSGVVVFRSREDRSWSTHCTVNARMSVWLPFGSNIIECITFLQNDNIVIDFETNHGLTPKYLTISIYPRFQVYRHLLPSTVPSTISSEDATVFHHHRIYHWLPSSLSIGVPSNGASMIRSQIPSQIPSILPPMLPSTAPRTIP